MRSFDFQRSSLSAIAIPALILLLFPAGTYAQYGESGSITISQHNVGILYQAETNGSSIAVEDTIHVQQPGNITISFRAGSGQELVNMSGTQKRYESSLSILLGSAVSSFYQGNGFFSTSAAVRYGGYETDNDDNFITAEDPASIDGQAASMIEHMFDALSRASASCYMSSSTSVGSLHLQTGGTISVARHNNSVRASALTSRNWQFTTNGPTTIVINAAWSFSETEFTPGGAGTTPQNPVLPALPSSPATFPPIADMDWIDPPSTYGYRYEVSDVLITGVAGWSPMLTGPVRVTVGGVDLGLFSEPMDFADHAAQLGDLLIDGSGVSAFEVTEITPRTHELDMLAFPIQLSYSGPTTSTMVMTAIPEPQISDVDPGASVPWASIEATASPNPFNPTASISYELDRGSDVSVTIHDVQGEHVRTLLHHVHQNQGVNHLLWRGDDDDGRAVASGVYIVKIQTEDSVGTVKLTLMK